MIIREQIYNEESCDLFQFSLFSTVAYPIWLFWKGDVSICISIYVHRCCNPKW